MMDTREKVRAERRGRGTSGITRGRERRKRGIGYGEKGTRKEERQKENIEEKDGKVCRKK